MSYRMAALNKNLIIIVACLLKKRKSEEDWLSWCETEVGSCVPKPQQQHLGCRMYIDWEHDTVIYEPTLCLVAYKFIASKTALNALYEEITMWASGGSNPGKSHICCCLCSPKPWRINESFKGVRMRKEWRKMSQNATCHPKNITSCPVLWAQVTQNRQGAHLKPAAVFSGATDLEHMLIWLPSYSPKVRHVLKGFELEL